jgi:hypothetical protein
MPKTHYLNNKDMYRQYRYKSRKKRVPILAKIVSEAKNKPCEDCGHIFPDFVMDFDHRPNEKKYKKVSYLVKVGYSISTLEKEIAKCDIVCANCHRVRSFYKLERNQSPSQALIYTRKYRNKLTSFIIEIKSEPCIDCHKSFHYCVMDFDHKNPEIKINSISRMISNCTSVENLKKEISKCDLVCANCHRIREEKRRGLNDRA